MNAPKMKVLYLFNGSREDLIEKIKTGEYHGGGFWGMLHLPKFGIEADYIELERVFPRSISKFLRRLIPVYAIHLPLFWKIFSYDIVFTSSAFFSQLIYSILCIRRPVWVMHDFSIVSIIGSGTSIKQKVFRWMTSRARGIVTLSDIETNRLKEMFPHLAKNIECIPFGVDLNFFKPSGISGRGVLAVGFDPERDWKTFVEAVRGIDVPVTIATRESRIEHLRPLPNHVSVRQFTPKELVQAYDESALVVVPLDTSSGVNDAMGLSTVYEAMAMGRPVIATRTSATETYIEDGKNGLLIPERDVQALKKTISNLLSNESLCKEIGDTAREYVLENLGISECASRLAVFLKKINE
jgi:glycosyltransferase involved in cell wall biosynthesis